MTGIKKTLKVIWLSFLSVFATSKMLENIEKDFEYIWGKDTDFKPAPSESKAGETHLG
jgi:hypothetical protein